MKVFEPYFEIIKEECLAIQESAYIPWPEVLLYTPGGWFVYGLFVNGKPIEQNCAGCPRTTEILASTPNVSTAGFSLLKAGAKIFSHEGYVAGITRHHMGIVVPEGDLGIQVDDQVHRWHEGHGEFSFDDQKWHKAWNNTKEDRIILLVDFVENEDGFQHIPDYLSYEDLDPKEAKIRPDLYIH